MKYLILSDMHGNWDAFSVVLDRVRSEVYDLTLVLGDLVGYGAAPNEVVEAVRAIPRCAVIRGNHDKVVAGIDRGENFNNVALTAARWTAEKLSAESLSYVRELPRGPRWIESDLAICHGSPLDEDAYVFSDYDAYEIFNAHRAGVTFFGHTHVPSLFAIGRGSVEVRALRGESAIVLEPDFRYLLNPGSIGQPRDRDPRAAYMTYDSETRTVRWHRVPYPVGDAQARIVDAGLPTVLADRLALGI